MVTIATDALGVRLGRRDVIDGVTAEIAGGTLIGIIGPNGAGKSTLVRAMLGLLPIASGAVRLDGAAIATVPRAEVARRIAYLPQGQTLHWPLSVERVVALGRLPHLAPFSRIGAADHDAIARAIDTVGIGHLRTRTATDLSGGERARVLLARALAVEAPALVVDEPLASLDPRHQLEVMDVLTGLAKSGVLVVAVLHDLSLAARFCERLLLMDAGTLVADGPPGDVLTPARLAAVFGVEAWFGTSDGAPLVVPLRRSS